MTVVSSSSLHKPTVLDLPRSPKRQDSCCLSCLFPSAVALPNIIQLNWFPFCVFSWRTIIWPPGHLSSTEREQVMKNASPYVFITKPKLGRYRNSVKVGQPCHFFRCGCPAALLSYTVVDTSTCLQVKNNLSFVPTSVTTDQGYCRTQEQADDSGSFRVRERVVVISSMYTKIMPETRAQWDGLGQWVVCLPALRCVYRLITHQCGVALT